jgi:hypothetical protein
MKKSELDLIILGQLAAHRRNSTLIDSYNELKMQTAGT